MTQCAAMAMKPSYSEFATFAMRNGYERGQCSRKAKIGSLCTQHEKVRLGQEFVKARMTRIKAREDKMKELLRKPMSEYNFEKMDGEFGCVYGVALLKRHFPDAYQIEGQSVYRVPSIEALNGWAKRKAKIVVTCRRLVRI